MYEARARVVATMAELVDVKTQADDMSDFLKAKQRISSEMFTPEGVAAEHLGLLFG